MILINVLIALGVSALFSVLIGASGVFLIALGAIGGLMGAANLFIGLILTAAGKNQWNQAFLISGGVLFLLGVGICGSMFLFM